MKTLLLSRAARSDLRDIYAYTYKEWGELHAETYLDSLRSAMERIADGTAAIHSLASRHQDMFKLRQGRHLIVCQTRNQNEILVVRVLHERMDIDVHIGSLNE